MSGPMVRLRSVREAVQAALATINGQGDYVHNLSTSDQVMAGVFDRPPAGVPFVAVATEEAATANSPLLSQRTWSLTLRIAGWVAGSPKHPSNRLEGAEELVDDMRLALLSDRTLAGLVQDMELAGAPFQAQDQRQLSAYGRAEMVMKVSWREDYRS